MKTKFYYKNFLIRTSDHDYKYALIVEREIDGEQVVYVKKCSSTYQGCEKELNRISKLYDCLSSAGISYDEWLTRQNVRCKYYDVTGCILDENDFDRSVKKIIRANRIWSDQYCDRRKLKIVELEAR